MSWRAPQELPDLRRVGRIALDTETNDEGLRADRGSAWPWGGGYICGASVAWREGGAIRPMYIPLRHPDTANIPVEQFAGWMKDLVVNSAVAFVGQKLVYDFGWLRADFGIAMPPPERLDDVSCMAALLDENQYSYSLEAMCARYGLRGKDDTLLREATACFATGRKKVVPQEHIWRLPAHLVGPYAERDPAATLELFEVLDPLLGAEGLRAAYRLDMAILAPVLEMRARGIRIDQDAAVQGRDYCLYKRDAALAELSAQYGSPIGMDEVNGRKWKIQAFDKYDIEYHLTENGNPSFAAGRSGWMRRSEHWLPHGIIAARRYHDAAVKFLEGHILRHIVNGRIHAEIHPFRAEDGGTRTSRFSCSDPPLQQVPTHDPELGKLIRRRMVVHVRLPSARVRPRHRPRRAAPVAGRLGGG